MPETNVPFPTLGDTGFLIPDDLDVLAGFLADLNQAFGGALNPSLSTPQGQIATSLAAVMSGVNDTFLTYTNLVDPARSSGRMQDAIARIYFLTRLTALPTSVTATVSGLPGTFIPAGSLAQATDGHIYQSVDSVTLDVTGTTTVGFESLETGPIQIPSGTLIRIYRTIPGWDAVTNAGAGVPGRDVETRQAFEQRRSASVALNATGILPAMRAVVLNVPDVLDAYVAENPTNASVTIGGKVLVAHSLYVAAVGGSDADVARAIWLKKNPGCDYNGNTTVTVVDNASGYSIPYPSYNVTFQRPSAVPIFFSVDIANSNGVPANAQTLIRDAILAAFNGQDGGPRARIGSTLFASRYYASVASLGPWASIRSLKVGITSPGALNSVTVQIDQVPTLTAGNITVTVT